MDAIGPVTAARMQAMLPGMTAEEKLELLALLELRDQAMRRNRLAYYKPYAKQLEFHAAGGSMYTRERLFMAGNQLGKTVAGAAEVAMHLTGRYPADWRGKRYSYAGRGLAGSESGELTRKGIQRLLLGPPEIRAEWGTGFIPGECIVDTASRPGVPDAVSSITVKHACGDLSVLQLASYDQGRTKWQADTVDFVWFDEEPPLALYSEGLVRTQATKGMVFVTFTPLLGMSDVVKRFVKDKEAGTTIINMTIEDAEHYTREEKDAIIASYPEHEREARARGVPMAGSGRVFPLAESGVRCEPFAIPSHWPRLVALDFGWGHPAAAVWLAWDRDTDTVYVYDCWRGKETTVPMQAMIIRARGEWIPVAWPHDGLQHDKNSGVQLAAQYKAAGVAMLQDYAKFQDGSIGFEAGISEMQNRFQARTLRVFSTLGEWFEEFRMYHRENGLVHKVDDDLMSATRVGIMAKRFGKTEQEVKGFSLANLTPDLGRPVILDYETGY